MMISLPITTLTALFAGVLILLLTIRVIQLSRRGGVVLGDNNDRALMKAIRGHANAVEQMPIALIMMGLSELQGGSTALLSVIAVVLIIGRTLHGAYFAFHGLHWRLRTNGMWMTVTAQAGLLLSLALTLAV